MQAEELEDPGIVAPFFRPGIQFPVRICSGSPLPETIIAVRINNLFPADPGDIPLPG